MTVNRIIRRTTQQMITGYVLGRRSPGQGPVELLALQDLQAMGIASQAQVANAAGATGFRFFVEGTMLANQTIGGGTWAHAVTFTNSDGTDAVVSGVAAHSDAAFQMKMTVGGVETAIGTITFLSGTKVGVVNWTGSPQLVPAATLFKLYAPLVADATLADVTGVVYGIPAVS